jgi:hypothetical protein
VNRWAYGKRAWSARHRDFDSGDREELASHGGCRNFERVVGSDAGAGDAAADGDFGETPGVLKCFETSQRVAVE